MMELLRPASLLSRFLLRAGADTRRRLMVCILSTLSLAVCLFGAARPASAEVAGTCSRTDDPKTRVEISESRARATVEITTDPARRGTLFNVDYDNETFAMQVDNNGRATLNLGLVEDTNTLTVTGPELSSAAGLGSVRCNVAAPDRDTVYRVILRWRNRVRLNLHVIEPGRRMWEYGHLYAGGGQRAGQVRRRHGLA